VYIKPIFTSVAENWNSTSFLKYGASSIAGVLERFDLVANAYTNGWAKLTRDLHQNISIVELPKKGVALYSSLKKWTWDLKSSKDLGIKFSSFVKHSCNILKSARDHSASVPGILDFTPTAIGTWKTRASLMESTLVWTNNYSVVSKIRDFSRPTLLEASAIVKFVGQSILVSSHIHLNYTQLMRRKVWGNFLLAASILCVLSYLITGYLKEIQNKCCDDSAR